MLPFYSVLDSEEEEKEEGCLEFFCCCFFLLLMMAINIENDIDYIDFMMKLDIFFYCKK